MAVYKTLAYCVMAAVMPVTACLWRIYVRQDAVLLGYALSAEEGRRDQLRAAQQQLDVAWAAAISPSRLTQMAGHLGLHPPRPAQRLVAEAARASGAAHGLWDSETGSLPRSESSHLRRGNP